MAVSSLATAPRLKQIFEATTLLAPLVPLVLLLVLERLALSMYEFSFWRYVAFRAAYLICLFLAVYLTFGLAAAFWFGAS